MIILHALPALRAMMGRPSALQQHAAAPTRVRSLVLSGIRRGRSGSSGGRGSDPPYNPEFFATREAASGQPSGRHSGRRSRRGSKHARRPTPGGEPTPAAQRRASIVPGCSVLVVQKHHQASGERTAGEVKRILTNSQQHPRGIKVMLTDGTVGRVHSLQGDVPAQDGKLPSAPTHRQRSEENANAVRNTRAASLRRPSNRSPRQTARTASSSWGVDLGTPRDGVQSGDRVELGEHRGKPKAEPEAKRNSQLPNAGGTRGCG
eukprot:CAMPEP_0185173596 /NCGR_PEP_ID=MMETSP1139-20130426/23730_1 /TAXON_ID=298111 /ORGANISM="Pavlova sp., Strain CCMP459" /LENGTH=261 /DNA_ID=CAMNT_0027739293 /DNA_START=19 /DNA_END=801 /DNA_ORIENTATION=+